MNKTIKRAQKLYEKFVDIHTDVYNYLSETNDEVKGIKLSLGDLVDMGYLCREIEKFMEELRKEIKFRKELCGKVISLAIAKQNLNDPGKVVERIEGELATGTPDVKLQAKLPNRGTEEFHKLLEFLDIPKEMAESKCFKLSWNGMTDLVTQLAEEGKPLPPGVEKSWPIYTTTFRRRKKRNRKDSTND